MKPPAAKARRRATWYAALVAAPKRSISIPSATLARTVRMAENDSSATWLASASASW